MQTIDAPHGYDIGKKLVKAVEVLPLTFEGWAKLSHRVATARPDDMPASAAYNTATMIEQSTVIFVDGTRGKYDYVSLCSMPVPLARKVMKATSQVNVGGAAGKIITEGDGVNTPIIMQLGTPIPTQKDDVIISELEFSAKNYGAVEKVFGETSEPLQAVAMLKHVAKPLSGGLQALPSWAIDKVSIADGLLIMDKVLKPFLEAE